MLSSTSAASTATGNQAPPCATDLARSRRRRTSSRVCPAVVMASPALSTLQHRVLRNAKAAQAAAARGRMGAMEYRIERDTMGEVQVPIDVFQTGSGTSSNMNANEVLATLAESKLGAKVHPNDHVNASQSSNDVFPTSIHLAATVAVATDLVPALVHLASTLDTKAAEWQTTVKAGRTHLMDATPVTLGQEFSGYAAQVRYGIERLQSPLPRLAELPLGGTAVGTG